LLDVDFHGEEIIKWKGGCGLPRIRRGILWSGVDFHCEVWTASLSCGFPWEEANFHNFFNIKWSTSRRKIL
jgi:hypothetical protein